MPKSISERHSWWLCAHCGEESGMLGHIASRELYNASPKKEKFDFCKSYATIKGVDQGWMCRKGHKCLTAEEFDGVREAYARKVQE